MARIRYMIILTALICWLGQYTFAQGTVFQVTGTASDSFTLRRTVLPLGEGVLAFRYASAYARDPDENPRDVLLKVYTCNDYAAPAFSVGSMEDEAIATVEFSCFNQNVEIFFVAQETTRSRTVKVHNIVVISKAFSGWICTFKNDNCGLVQDNRKAWERFSSRLEGDYFRAFLNEDRQVARFTIPGPYNSSRGELSFLLAAYEEDRVEDGSMQLSLCKNGGVSLFTVQPLPLWGWQHIRILYDCSTADNVEIVFVARTGMAELTVKVDYIQVQEYFPTPLEPVPVSSANVKAPTSQSVSTSVPMVTAARPAPTTFIFRRESMAEQSPKTTAPIISPTDHRHSTSPESTSQSLLSSTTPSLPWKPSTVPYGAAKHPLHPGSKVTETTGANASTAHDTIEDNYRWKGAIESREDGVNVTTSSAIVAGANAVGGSEVIPVVSAVVAFLCLIGLTVATLYICSYRRRSRTQAKSKRERGHTSTGDPTTHTNSAFRSLDDLPPTPDLLVGIHQPLVQSSSLDEGGPFCRQGVDNEYAELDEFLDASFSSAGYPVYNTLEPLLYHEYNTLELSNHESPNESSHAYFVLEDTPVNSEGRHYEEAGPPGCVITERGVAGPVYAVVKKKGVKGSFKRTCSERGVVREPTNDDGRERGVVKSVQNADQETGVAGQVYAVVKKKGVTGSSNKVFRKMDEVEAIHDINKKRGGALPVYTAIRKASATWSLDKVCDKRGVAESFNNADRERGVAGERVYPTAIRERGVSMSSQAASKDRVMSDCFQDTLNNRGEQSEEVNSRRSLSSLQKLLTDTTHEYYILEPPVKGGATMNPTNGPTAYQDIGPGVIELERFGESGPQESGSARLFHEVQYNSLNFRDISDQRACGLADRITHLRSSHVVSEDRKYDRLEFPQNDSSVGPQLG